MREGHGFSRFSRAASGDFLRAYLDKNLFIVLFCHSLCYYAIANYPILSLLVLQHQYQLSYLATAYTAMPLPALPYYCLSCPVHSWGLQNGPKIVFFIYGTLKKTPLILDLAQKGGGGLAQSETLIFIWSVKTQC